MLIFPLVERKVLDIVVAILRNNLSVNSEIFTQGEIFAINATTEASAIVFGLLQEANLHVNENVFSSLTAESMLRAVNARSNKEGFLSILHDLRRYPFHEQSISIDYLVPLSANETPKFKFSPFSKVASIPSKVASIPSQGTNIPAKKAKSSSSQGESIDYLLSSANRGALSLPLQFVLNQTCQMYMTCRSLGGDFLSYDFLNSVPKDEIPRTDSLENFYNSNTSLKEKIESEERYTRPLKTNSPMEVYHYLTQFFPMANPPLLMETKTRFSPFLNDQLSFLEIVKKTESAPQLRQTVTWQTKKGIKLDTISADYVSFVQNLLADEKESGTAHVESAFLALEPVFSFSLEAKGQTEEISEEEFASAVALENGNYRIKEHLLLEKKDYEKN